MTIGTFVMNGGLTTTLEPPKTRASERFVLATFSPGNTRQRGCLRPTAGVLGMRRAELDSESPRSPADKGVLEGG